MANPVGSWAFIIGIILAILAGLATVPYAALILLILGLIVGFLNITEKEVNSFLIASVALIMIGTAGLASVDFIGLVLAKILANIAAFVAPAALVVALKSVYALSKD